VRAAQAKSKMKIGSQTEIQSVVAEKSAGGKPSGKWRIGTSGTDQR
jgi:hypothetical protein